MESSIVIFMTREGEWLLEEKYRGEKTEGFFIDCERLEAGEPLAYIIGHVPFLNTTIYLDSHPLIPRTETEYWVEYILLNIKVADSKETKILDLCAGSGCVGVAVLKNTQHAHVDFVEIETRHHKTIQKNILENEIDISRAHIVSGNLFEKVDDVYSFILTNPPYIDKTLNRTELSVATHEPHEALYAEEGGLAYIKQIIDVAPQYLTPNGVLVIEHEPEHTKKITALGEKNSFFTITHEDQYGVERYTILTRKSV